MTARNPVWREALFGLVAGAWLSAARAPLGLDWLEIPATSGAHARLVRALGLATVAFALLSSTARVRSRSALLLWSAALGFAAHGLFAAHLLDVAGWWSLALGASVATLALCWLARGASDDLDVVPAIPLELLGLGLAGAGLGLAFDRVANVLRMESFGRPQDDTAMALTFTALVAFGASAFGPLIAKHRAARIALPLAAVVAAAACWESVGALSRMGDRDGLETFLRHPLPALEGLFGRPLLSLAPSHVGQLDGDLLIAARVLILPALALGAALAWVRDRRRLGALAMGAALQLVLLGRGSLFDAADLPLAPARAVALGVAFAAAGAALAIAMFVERSTSARALQIGACAAIAAGVWFAPRWPAMPLTPWEAVAPLPYWTASTDAGLATVERARDASRIATLDRRRLTPLDGELAADARRLRCIGHAANVLLVGQLTPARVASLKSVGVERVDRTAVWWREMSAMERALFDEAPIEILGDILAPHRARELAELGTYDAVLIPPIAGASPVIELPALPASTRVVAWLDARAEITSRYWGERVLLSSDGGEQLAIGVASGELGRYPAGAQTFDQLPLDALLLPRVQRPFANEARASARLAQGSRATPTEKLTAGLARHFAAQVDSSPYETHAQQIELDPQALALLRDAALEREPDAFVRELWDVLADTLVEKREVESIEELLAPLAERWRPWPALERARAIAALELLDPATAVDRLAVAIEGAPKDVELRRLRARAAQLCGRSSDAVSELEAAALLQPTRRDLRRELAMARVRAGDAAGPAGVEALLRENPDDTELTRYLGPGPLPPPPPALEPPGGRHVH